MPAASARTDWESCGRRAATGAARSRAGSPPAARTRACHQPSATLRATAAAVSRQLALARNARSRSRSSIILGGGIGSSRAG